MRVCFLKVQCAGAARGLNCWGYMRLLVRQCFVWGDVMRDAVPWLKTRYWKNKLSMMFKKLKCLGCCCCCCCCCCCSCCCFIARPISSVGPQLVNCQLLIIVLIPSSHLSCLCCRVRRAPAQLAGQAPQCRPAPHAPPPSCAAVHGMHGQPSLVAKPRRTPASNKHSLFCAAAVPALSSIPHTACPASHAQPVQHAAHSLLLQC